MVSTINLIGCKSFQFIRNQDTWNISKYVSIAVGAMMVSIINLKGSKRFEILT